MKEDPNDATKYANINPENTKSKPRQINTEAILGYLGLTLLSGQVNKPGNQFISQFIVYIKSEREIVFLASKKPLGSLFVFKTECLFLQGVDVYIP